MASLLFLLDFLKGRPLYMPKHSGKWVSYLRVSTNAQGKSGLEAQRKAVDETLTKPQQHALFRLFRVTFRNIQAAGRELGARWAFIAMKCETRL